MSNTQTRTLTEERRARIAREERHAAATRWPEGDSWVQGYAEDVPLLLDVLEAVEARNQELTEALGHMLAHPASTMPPADLCQCWRCFRARVALAGSGPERGDDAP